MKNRAIVVFLDHGDGFYQQYKTLEYCWKHTEIIDDTDFVVFCLPELITKISSDCKIIPFIPHGSNNLKYEFLKSIEIFTDPSAEFLSEYQDVLRTDLDVFLAPPFKDFRSQNKFYCGKGAYWNDSDVKNNIDKACKELSLNHHGHVNVGSTWYSNGKNILEVGKLTYSINKYLLETYFKDRIFNWPNWTYGVSLLYASEMAINHLQSHNLIITNKLDQHSDVSMSINDSYHIHCWHTDKMFSKFAFMNGKYDNISINSLNINDSIDYCLACALKSKGEII